MNVLVTGGAGYIGAHAALALLEAGHAVSIIDDLSRGHRAAVGILEPRGDVAFVEGDLGDRRLVAELLRRRAVDLVLHFGARAYVGESVAEPLRYWRANVAATVGLLEAMADAGVGRLVFSSSCATYGAPPPERIPIDESCPQRPVNPYGFTKYAGERLIADHAAATPGFAAAFLRYFNVAGCDPEGRLGEDHEPETHLVPLCLLAALGRREGIAIHGDDYPTPDGTCIRDYVHVSDLAAAHLAAMAALRPGPPQAWNVGIGRGHSVREVVDACRRVTGAEFPVTVGPRRAGDPPELRADAARIGRELGWSPRHTAIDAIVASAWRWFREHPEGYGTVDRPATRRAT